MKLISEKLEMGFGTDMPILKHSACDSVNLKYLAPLATHIRLISRCYSWGKNRYRRTKIYTYSC